MLPPAICVSRPAVHAVRFEVQPQMPKRDAGFANGSLFQRVPS
jgi:hypothetical protein